MKILAAILLLFAGLIVVGCDTSEDVKPLPPIGGTEVLRNVYDDQQSAVYIKVDKPESGKEDAALTEIMTKKKEWERMFPAKKVVAMSIVTGDVTLSSGHPAVFGLLIHYEQR